MTAHRRVRYRRLLGTLDVQQRTLGQYCVAPAWTATQLSALQQKHLNWSKSNWIFMVRDTSGTLRVVRCTNPTRYASKKMQQRTRELLALRECQIAKFLGVHGLAPHLYGADFSPTSGVLALDMAYGGVSLHAFLRQEDARAYVSEVAAKLASAIGSVAQYGIYLGDLKPANVVVDTDRRQVLFIDFEAHLMDVQTRSSSATETLSLVTTAQYGLYMFLIMYLHLKRTSACNANVMHQSFETLLSTSNVPPLDCQEESISCSTTLPRLLYLLLWAIDNYSLPLKASYCGKPAPEAQRGRADAALLQDVWKLLETLGVTYTSTSAISLPACDMRDDLQVVESWREGQDWSGLSKLTSSVLPQDLGWRSAMSFRKCLSAYHPRTRPTNARSLSS